MEACTFYTLSPKTGAPRKREPAFHFQNVVEYELSVGMEREEPMRRVEKMVAMNTKLSDLIQEHQFEYLMFPCYLLPMKVGVCYQLKHGSHCNFLNIHLL